MAKVIRVLLKVVCITAAAATIATLATYRDLTGIFLDAETYRDTTLYIIIHHDGADKPISIKAIQDYHKDVNGWESGFGYNFYLKNGKIYQLHEVNACTANALGYNCNAVSICIHTPDKHDTRTQLNLILLVNALAIKYDIKKDHIVGHGELPNQRNTRCPELNLEKLRKWIIGN